MLDLDRIAPATWAELAEHAAGIFADVDDTLTARDFFGGTLVPAAYAALCEARAAGLRVVLVTGRPGGWARVLAALLPIDAAIAENGALAALPGGRILYFDDEEARRAGLSRRERARVRVARELPAVRSARDQPLREIDLAFDVAEHERLSEEAVAQLAHVLRDEGLATVRSSIHLHGTFSRADKASMCARVAEVLWQEREETLKARYLFVGDSPNDAAAFAYFRHSIGVRNVLDHVDELRARGALPWAVTAGHGGHGFAEAVRRLLSARGQQTPQQ